MGGRLALRGGTLVCEAGPVETGWAEALALRCAVPVDAAATALRSEVWVAAPDPARVELGDDPRATALPELGRARVVDAVGGTRGAWPRLAGAGVEVVAEVDGDGAPPEPAVAWPGGAIAWPRARPAAAPARRADGRGGAPGHRYVRSAALSPLVSRGRPG